MDPIDIVKNLEPFGRLSHWIMERDKIRFLKEKNAKKPWTEDAILRSYRFCNVRRMDDKVSRWLMENWYTPNFNHPSMPIAVALARFINKPESLEAIGFPKRWEGRTWKSILKKVSKYGPVFNAAYLVRAQAGEDKITSVVDRYVKPLYQKPLRLKRDSMRDTWATLLEYNGYGSFMAGQVVADLRWAMKGEWKDRMTWAPMGPGSQRGLNRLYGHPINTTWDELSFQEALTEVISIVKENVSKGITKNLEAHDYQNCLCEFDKYERCLWGEGRPKQIYPGT